jgi:hypothetical protein
MSIVGYPGWPPVIDANTRDHVRFAMSDGRRVLLCRIAITTLRDWFGEEDSEPIDLFESCQSEIEDAADKRYTRYGITNAVIDLGDEDFA